MRKNRIVQFSLVITAFLLFFFTYYYSDKEKTKIVNIGKKTLSESYNNLTNEMSNIIENASYSGTDNRGTFFTLKADLAEVYSDKPNISNMKVVNAIINLEGGKKIYIQSDICLYDRSTNDAKFVGNVTVTEADNKITSDNLDLFMTKNLITVYNNVEYNNKKGFLVADKIDIDILNNESNIFMFDKKKKVKIKYNN